MGCTTVSLAFQEQDLVLQEIIKIIWPIKIGITALLSALQMYFAGHCHPFPKSKASKSSGNMLLFPGHVASSRSIRPFLQCSLAAASNDGCRDDHPNKFS